jgi:hypothetical protein
MPGIEETVHWPASLLTRRSVRPSSRRSPQPKNRFGTQSPFAVHDPIDASAVLANCGRSVTKYWLDDLKDTKAL